MKGSLIRKKILDAGLKVWQVAKAYGVADTTFSKYLRGDFSEENAARILNIIDELADEKSDTVYIEEITGTVGKWLSGDFSDIPIEAMRHLEKAYEICAAEYKK